MADDQDKSQQTEEPTAKRLEQARESGDVVKSTEVTAFVLLGGATLAIAMFGKYALTTGKNLNMPLTGLIIITAGLAFGGGLASVISPAKLQNAAASIDKLGEEAKVIRIALVFSILLTAVTSLFVLLFLSAKGLL